MHRDLDPAERLGNSDGCRDCFVANAVAAKIGIGDNYRLPFSVPACAICSRIIRSTTRRAASMSIARHAGDSSISRVSQIQGMSLGGRFSRLIAVMPVRLRLIRIPPTVTELRGRARPSRIALHLRESHDGAATTLDADRRSQGICSDRGMTPQALPCGRGSPRGLLPGME